VAALKLAFDADYRTSVSAEPLLGGLDTARAVMSAVRLYVTDTVWIGKLNKGKQRVDMSNPVNAEQVTKIELAQNYKSIMDMYAALKEDSIIEWKDSIKTVAGLI
jgi:hypothetical protein